MIHAAVVIPILRDDEPRLIFVRRAHRLRRNPGQIAFPGGLIDPDDAGSEAAALREFEEELGIARERVAIVDRLEDVVTLALAATVTPYVGAIDPPVAYAVDPEETAAVYEVPVAALYAAGALHHGIERAVAHEGRTYDVPSWLFDYDGMHVWGATARMLHALVTRYPTPAALATAFPGLR